MKNQHKNFTLVELAVIIFCCAAITAVTLPLAHGTVEQAKSITCMNKLKNIGQAALQYAKSNSNIVPCRVRDAKTNTVNDFGNWFHVWSKALIWGGYFGEKPTVSYNAGNVKYGKEYFGCPDDKNLHTDKKSTGSYIIFNLNRSWRATVSVFLRKNMPAWKLDATGRKMPSFLTIFPTTAVRSKLLSTAMFPTCCV